MCCDHAENQLRICLDLSGYVREYLFELIFVSFFFGVLSELIKDLSLTMTMAVSTFTHEYVLSCLGKRVLMLIATTSIAQPIDLIYTVK